MKFIISDFNQEISSINDGKQVDVSLTFKVILNKSSLSQKFIEEIFLALLQETLV